MKKTYEEIRPFLRPFSRHLRAMALGTGFGLAAACAAVGLLALSGWFITAAALAGATAAGAAGFNFFYPSIGVRIFAVGRTLARYAERVFSHDATFRILSDLRADFYRQVEPKAPAGLMRFESGDLLQRVVADIDTLDHLYLRLASPLVVAIVVVCGVVGAMGVIDAAAAVSAATSLVAGGAGAAVFAGRLGAGAGRSMTAAAARLRTRVVEGLHCAAELLAYGAKDRFLAKVAVDRSELIRRQRFMSRLGAAADALVSIASGAGALVVLWLVCRLAATHRIDPAAAALAVFALIAAFESVLPLSAAFQHLGGTGEAAGRLSEVLAPSDIVVFPERSTGRAEGFDVRFDSVRFRYPQRQRPVLDDFTLHVPHRRRLALLGPTGTGKSTLVHLLCRFQEPASGRITIGGAEISGFSEQALRGMMAVVSQRDHLFGATLRENLTLACPDAGDEKLLRALDAVGLERFVRELPDGLDTWIGAGGRGVSGGQARRLFIARAVLHDAPIWLFDEPTEGLDRRTEEAVFESLFSLSREKTVLVITHRPVMLDRFDTAAVMENGRIVEFGAHETLMAAGGRYAQLAGQIR